ncbi:MAG: UpxY family transcription antiterminator [Odoribacter sp.]|nr:UpxY family transcription antiterminator [Odoribacter sp.]
MDEVAKRDSLETSRAVRCNFLTNNWIEGRTGLEELPLSEKELKRWYVMRDLKRSNAALPAYKQLAALNVELFTPMKQRLTVIGGKKVRKEVPFLQDLLFVYATREKLDTLVQSIPTLQYRFIKGGKYCEAMTVRNREMEHFIHAIRSTDNPRYYTPEEITPAMQGRRVRIIGGPLDNYEGCLLTVRGSKSKRLLLEIPNLISTGIEISDCDYVLV